MLFYLWSLNGSTGKNAKTLSSGCGLYSSRLIFFLSRVQPVAGDKLMPCVCIHSMPYWTITRGWLGHLDNSGVGRDRHAPNASETCDRLFLKNGPSAHIFPTTRLISWILYTECLSSSTTPPVFTSVERNVRVVRGCRHSTRLDLLLCPNRIQYALHYILNHSCHIDITL